MFLVAEHRIQVAAGLIQQRQMEPVHAVDQHAQPGAQVARHHIHQAHLPAVGVEQHQLLHAAGRHALADLGPQAQHRFGFQRERAGEARVFGRVAHGLRGQEQRGQIRRDVRDARGDHTVGDVGVHRQRQVRAVLLDRGHGQHGHGARLVQQVKVGGGEVGPVAQGACHVPILRSAYIQ
ncbi:hypothetical protein D9M69_558920 [compost metagenome]